MSPKRLRNFEKVSNLLSLKQHSLIKKQNNSKFKCDQEVKQEILDAMYYKIGGAVFLSKTTNPLANSVTGI